MKKLSVFLVVAVALFLSLEVAQAQMPVAVSPGSTTQDAIVGQTCPAFSWSSVEGASTYSVAVFERQTNQILSYEEMMSIAAPVLSFNIDAPALSWTPSVGSCLKSGSEYVWYVSGTDSEGGSTWSAGKAFQVEASALTVEQKDAVQEAVKAYLNGEGAKTASMATMNGGAQVSLTSPSDQVSPMKKYAEADKSSAAIKPSVASGTDVPSIVLGGNMALNGYDIVLGTDNNNGLGWYGSGKTFAGEALNGPVLYGSGGGALGTTAPNTIALRWDRSGNVGIVGNLNVGSITTGWIVFPNGSKQTTASTDCTGRYELNRNVTYPNGDGTVTDCRTGLIWLKNVVCTDTSNGIARTANGGKLNWADAKTWAAGLGNGKCGLQDGSYPGDWRLPTKTELMAMFQSARNQNIAYPALTNAAGTGQWTVGDIFDNVQPAGREVYLWSSTEFSPTQAWYFYMSDGTTLANFMTVSYDVWTVRAGQ